VTYTLRTTAAAMLSSRLSLLSLVLAAAGLVNAFPLANTARALAASDCTQPKLSDNPAEWSSRAFIAEKLPTPITPTPVFWSGRYNGTSIQPRAIECADKTKGATIGMLMCQLGGFTMPSSSTTEANALWTYASEVFADYTKGNAFVVMGEARVTSVWFDAEFPTLRENPGVKSVISLDPGTCNQKCYWHCPDAKDCPVSVLSLCFCSPSYRSPSNE
jgi:hypothetical protein